jgi:hypothetical protein
MTVYNVQIPVILLVEAEDEAGATRKARHHLDTLGVTTGEGQDVFESEDGYDPEIR